MRELRPRSEVAWLAPGKSGDYEGHMSHMGVSQNWGYLIGGPQNKDCSILGSILGSPYSGKLPYGDLLGSG